MKNLLILAVMIFFAFKVNAQLNISPYYGTVLKFPGINKDTNNFNYLNNLGINVDFNLRKKLRWGFILNRSNLEINDKYKELSASVRPPNELVFVNKNNKLTQDFIGTAPIFQLGGKKLNISMAPFVGYSKSTFYGYGSFISEGVMYGGSSPINIINVGLDSKSNSLKFEKSGFTILPKLQLNIALLNHLKLYADIQRPLLLPKFKQSISTASYSDDNKNGFMDTTELYTLNYTSTELVNPKFVTVNAGLTWSIGNKKDKSKSKPISNNSNEKMFNNCGMAFLQDSSINCVSSGPSITYRIKLKFLAERCYSKIENSITLLDNANQPLNFTFEGVQPGSLFQNTQTLTLKIMDNNSAINFPIHVNANIQGFCCSPNGQVLLNASGQADVRNTNNIAVMFDVPNCNPCKTKVEIDSIKCLDNGKYKVCFNTSLDSNLTFPNNSITQEIKFANLETVINLQNPITYQPIGPVGTKNHYCVELETSETNDFQISYTLLNSSNAEVLCKGHKGKIKLPNCTNTCCPFNINLLPNTSFSNSNSILINQKFTNNSSAKIVKIYADIIDLGTNIEKNCLQCITNQEHTTFDNSKLIYNTLTLDGIGIGRGKTSTHTFTPNATISNGEFSFSINTPLVNNSLACQKEKITYIRYTFVDENCKSCEYLIKYSDRGISMPINNKPNNQN